LTGLNSPYFKLDLPDQAPIELTSNHAQFDLTANIIEHAGFCLGAFEYNTDIFTLTDIKNIVEEFKRLLSLVREPYKNLPLKSLAAKSEHLPASEII